ncbi:hypothetical protein BD626DRAFT_513518 [Schizophyllum amplum]|uniref:DUF7330 domain-containing protein n=1 Tax=Schizophyllum amplum TaxID=97359 RepID=A0A550BZ38_9AGAR|nr:hypothetical protein BD626DRAFT_513518 [Auriculariopsis ampla]
MLNTLKFSHSRSASSASRSPQKSISIETSHDIVASYLLDPTIDVDADSPPKTQRALSLKSNGKIDVCVDIAPHHYGASNTEGMHLYLSAYKGPLSLRLRIPNLDYRAPILVEMDTRGSKAFLYLPRSFHGQLVINQCSENYCSTRFSFRGDMPTINGGRRVAVSKAVREAATSVSVSSDGKIICDIRDSHHRRGRDVAKVTALEGAVTVRYEDEKNVWGRLLSL